MAKRRIVLLAHNVRSLWNVGSFFRTCDALAVEKIYLTGYTGHPPRKEIAKVALGADDTIPFESAPEPLPILESLKSDGWEIVSLELGDKSINLKDFQPTEKTCLVLGHELSGVPEDILAISDRAVQIPMLGEKESLNVAVAAGIALYHLRTF